MDLELYRKIRQYTLMNMSQRDIAKKLGISRTTVVKYCEGAIRPIPKPSRTRKKSKGAEALMDVMKAYYKENKDKQTLKHKITAQTLYREFHEQYPFSPASYRRFWRQVSGEKSVNTKTPLKFAPGEMAQLDWKYHKAIIKDKKVDIYVLCIYMMYSGAVFFKAYSNMQQLNIIDGLEDAFIFFNGVPQIILTDNMMQVRKSGNGKKAVVTEEFKRFSAHYCVEFEFTNARKPYEKGGVEKGGAGLCGNVLVPLLTVDSIDEVNNHLLKFCIERVQEGGKIGTRDKKVKELFKEEIPFLKKLPLAQYHSFHEKYIKVNSLQQFKYKNFVYSVPYRYAGKYISIKAYAFHVEFYYKGECFWTCRRPLFDGETGVYAAHYIHNLKYKNRSINNAAPLMDGVLPTVEFEVFRKKCRNVKKNDDVFNLLMRYNEYDEEMKQTLLKVVTAVNNTGYPTYKRIMATLEKYISTDNTLTLEEIVESLKRPDDNIIDELKPSEAVELNEELPDSTKHYINIVKQLTEQTTGEDDNE